MSRIEDQLHDYTHFMALYEQADKPREGYWTPFSVLVWLISRDDRYVAAAQLYEREEHANRDGSFIIAAWIEIGAAMGVIYGRNLSHAEGDLREALEADRLLGGVAISCATGKPREIERKEWLGWHRTFETVGLCLLPGHRGFCWPSENVRAAFPALAQTEKAIAQPFALPVLPAHAKPNDHKHVQYAHEAAALLRSDKSLKPETAFAKVAPEEPMRKALSITRAIRSAFELLYGADGTPHQN